MFKIKTIVLTMFSATLFAENIELSLKNNNGNSSYIVQSPSQNLKAKLIFPFKFSTFDLNYAHEFSFFDIKIGSSFLLNHKTTTGKDYDWQNDNLTVFSSSDNKIDKYSKYSLEISKDIFYDLKIFANFDYKILDMYWSNTAEEDFVKNENSYVKDLTLKFQQEFFQHNLGLTYKNNIYKNILVEIQPSFIYAFVKSKDTHVLRSFYIKQNSKAIGFGLKLNTTYSITDNSKIKLSLNYETLEDKNVNMDYYNVLNQKYKTLPSSYKYKNQTIGLSYSYDF